MRSPPTRIGSVGIWSWRWLVAHQRTSVFDVLSWSRLLCIHNATSSRHADICSRSSRQDKGEQKPYTCVSSAYPCGCRLCLSISCKTSAAERGSVRGPIPVGRRRWTESDMMTVCRSGWTGYCNDLLTCCLHLVLLTYLWLGSSPVTTIVTSLGKQFKELKVWFLMCQKYWSDY